MKKLIAIVLLVSTLGIGGYYGFQYVYANHLGPPAVRMCHKIADLCQLDGETVDGCERKLELYTKYYGQQTGENLFSCMEQSQSCGEVRGCEVGAWMHGRIGMVKGMMEGIQPGFGASMDEAMQELGQAFGVRSGNATSKETTDRAKKLK